MNICNYNELPHFTNIYSLSVFDTPNKRGCILSTSRHLYRFLSRKNGEVKLMNIKLSKVHITAEIEIHSQSVLSSKDFLYICFIYKSRKDNDPINSLVSMRFRTEDIYTPDQIKSIDLDYIPYKAFIVSVIKRLIEEEIILFVSGSNSINCYSPDSLECISRSSMLSPHFLNHPAPVISASTMYHIKYFFVVFGCQNGQISLLKYNTDPFSHKSVTKINFDGPIASLLLFEIESEVADLLIVCAVGYCALYRDLSQELNSKIIIRPPCSDALTCAAASDVDFDGQKEIIIGSFSKEIFCYKLVESELVLLWQLEFMHPVLCVSEIDLNKDGLNEIVVVTMYGVSVLSPQHSLARDKLQAVKRYLETRSSHD